MNYFSIQLCLDLSLNKKEKIQIQKQTLGRAAFWFLKKIFFKALQSKKKPFVTLLFKYILKIVNWIKKPDIAVQL
jgi:hypothetical protein